MKPKANIEEVLANYSGLLARIASSYESNKQLQEDLLQDISLAVWRALEKFEEQSSLKTYIAKIAHNRSVDHVLKYSKKNEHSFDDLTHDYVDESSSLGSNEKSIDLMSALRRLSIKYRQVITMQLEGFTQADIANVLGIQQDAVAKRASRARQMLEQWL